MSVFLVVGVVAIVLLIAGVSRARRGPLDPEKRAADDQFTVPVSGEYRLTTERTD
jgi:hypothetical protein